MDYYTLQNILIYLFQIYRFLIFGYIIMSWIPSLQQSSIGTFIGKLVEPYLGLFRKIIPPIGMIDISPIVALLALQFIFQGLLIVIQNIFSLFM